MTYNTLTKQEIERIFAEDVLGWKEGAVNKELRWWMCEGEPVMFKDNFHPLTDLNHAILGLEKLGHQWGMAHGFDGYQVRLYEERERLCKVDSDNLNAAIVEACIRIKRPDLFTEG